MSQKEVVRDAQFGGDDIGRLLAGVVRLVKGTVAATFIPKEARDSPVAWAALPYADVAEQLIDLAVERLRVGGPWGETRADTWSAWLEQVLLPSEEGTQAEPIGVLAVAVPGQREFDEEARETLRVFANLSARVTRAGTPTYEATSQRRVDDLVSSVSERLMSTKAANLQVDLDWTIETLCHFTGADAAFLRRNDHAAGASVLMAEFPRRGVPLAEDPLGIVPFDADPIFRALRDLKVPLILPQELDESYTNRVAEGAGELDGFSGGGFTGGGVPLLHDGVTEGVLGFLYVAYPDWSEHELNALRAVATILVQLLHRVDAEDRLRRNALTDDLTGLPNRRALLEEVSARQESGGGPLALLFIDLDRFKVMNDHLGHNAGDKVLQVIADRIRTSLRPRDFAARLGGDEFVVLLEGAGGGLGAVAAANRLLEVIARPIDVSGQHVAHTGSVGISLSEEGTLSGEELLGQADIALYAAKSQGRNRAVVFDHRLEADVAARSSTELLLRQALSEQALHMLYQPEFDLLTGRLLALEALVRWRRDGGELVTAAEFISVAEETFLITDIDRWVLSEACTQMATWRRAFPRLDLVVRVNTSPAHLAVNGVAQAVADCLRHSGLPPEALCLEITEQAVIADVDQAVGALHQVRAMGVKIALDDFGTGFSSMVQLKNLPVDVLKIDRVFVDGIARDQTDQAIVETIVRLASAFRLEVVGEGVERIADLETLVRLGCTRAQGYLLARPLSPTDLEPLLMRGGIDLVEVGAAAAAAAARG